MYGFRDLDEKNLENPDGDSNEFALVLLIICLQAIFDLYQSLSASNDARFLRSEIWGGGRKV